MLGGQSRNRWLLPMWHVAGPPPEAGSHTYPAEGPTPQAWKHGCRAGRLVGTGRGWASLFWRTTLGEYPGDMSCPQPERAVHGFLWSCSKFPYAQGLQTTHKINLQLWKLEVHNESAGAESKVSAGMVPSGSSRAQSFSSPFPASRGHLYS